MKKLLLWIIGIIVVVFVASLFITTKTAPPKDARIILDYTHETYIAPPCFEQADPTNNNIGEADLGAAQEINFTAHDDCTESEFEEEEDILLIALLKKAGLLRTKWEEW